MRASFARSASYSAVFMHSWMTLGSMPMNEEDAMMRRPLYSKNVWPCSANCSCTPSMRRTVLAKWLCVRATRKTHRRYS